MVAITSTTGVAGQHQRERLQVGLLQESAADNITALAGGGQAGATLLTNEINRVTTVATAGDSVLLPVSLPGLSVAVINAGANAMQVYGNGSDTINGVAAAAGVSQMPSSATLYLCATAGAWFTNGTGEGFSGSLMTVSYTEGITAHAGGGRASAVPIVAMITRVTTVASAADSVVLPAAVPGLELTIINAGANAAQVFASGSDTIDGTAGATGVSQAAAKTVQYLSTAAGTWHRLISA
jgi:hypothetical protein